MDISGSFTRVSIFAVVLIPLGAWFITFASRMMRSKDLADYKKALRVSVFATAAYWCVWVPAVIWPGMEEFSRKMSATIAIAIALLSIFRNVKDVSVTKKVVIWFVWSALDICVVLLLTSLFGA